MRRREEFDVTLRQGRRVTRGPLVVHYRDGATGGVRVGFVVSRAVGSAVQRNLVRRRLRHLVHGRLAGLPTGRSLVIRALPGAAAAGFPELAAAVDGAFARAGTP